MKLTLSILGFAILVVAQQPQPSVLDTKPIPIPPIPSIPTPEPPKPIPPAPPTETAPDPSQPTVTGGPAGPICECGYTYCSSVLLSMKKPWNLKQLSDAYCSTPNVACANGAPATNVSSALYICLCDDIDQKLGTDLDLIAGCDNCQIIGPDFRGRCETPCYGSKYGGGW